VQQCTTGRRPSKHGHQVVPPAPIRVAPGGACVRARLTMPWLYVAETDYPGSYSAFW